MAVPRSSLRSLVGPSHTALVTQECQVGIIGPGPLA